MENIIYLKGKFLKILLNFVEISLGDLSKNFSYDKKYLDYFDLILANLPQTPSEEEIRSIKNYHFFKFFFNLIEDKHGGNMGCNLFMEMFEELRNIISLKKDQKSKQTEIYIL